MSAWNSLPSELLFTIFKQLKTRDALQCQLVCQDWSKTAQQAAYTSVRILKSHRLYKFVRTLSTAPSFPGNYVRALTLHYIEFDDSEDMDLMDSDIESEIDFGSNNEDMEEDIEDTFHTLAQYTPFLENLQANYTTRLFWLLVTQLRYEQYWKHIIQLPKPSNNGDNQYYRGAVLALRDTMKEVTLLDASAWSSRKQNKKHHSMFIKKLAEFKQLKTLRFELDMTCSTAKLNGIMDAFSNIEHLLIESKENFTFKTIDSINPNTTLRSINLKGYIIATEILVYLVTKLPCLKQLNIKADKCSLRNSLSSKDKQELAHYLLRLDQCEIKNMQCNDIHSFIRILTDEHKYGSLTIHVYVKNEEEVEEDEDEDEEREEVNYLSTLVKYNRKAAFNSQVRLTVYNDMQSGSLATILSDYGEMIDELQIKGIVCYNNESNDTNPRLNLQDVLITCIKLERLELSNLYFTNFHLMHASNIQQLSLNNCTFSPTIFRDISKYLPQLCSLQVIHSKLLDTDGKDVTKTMPHVYFDMPHTTFESFSFVIIGDTNHLFLKVTQETGETYYKCREYNMMDSTSEQYYQAHQHHIRTFHLHCKSVKHVHLVKACSTLF